MILSSRGAVLLAALLAVLVGGCGGKNGDANGPAPGGNPPGGGGPPSEISRIMGKLGRGPMALTNVLREELDAEPPPWDKIQPQAKEYAQLAAALGQSEPPKGSKESWAKQTAAYAAAAAALDRAAQAKDRAAAKEAHDTLSNSCMACHREHRGMAGPGRGR
jgi:hypothetical protein